MTKILRQGMLLTDSIEALAQPYIPLLRRALDMNFQAAMIEGETESTMRVIEHHDPDGQPVQPPERLVETALKAAMAAGDHDAVPREPNIVVHHDWPCTRKYRSDYADGRPHGCTCAVPRVTFKGREVTL